MYFVLWEDEGVLRGRELPEVWKEGGRMGVQTREKRRKVEDRDEIKRMRETSAPKIGQNTTLKGDGGKEAKGRVAP